jgi:hypothetical protein
MSLGKRLIGAGAGVVCNTDSVQPFGADSAFSSNIALYQLDGNANDTTGDYNGTATNVTYSTGQFGQAAVFNGSTSFIDTNIDSSIGNSYSISLWFNSNSNASTWKQLTGLDNDTYNYTAFISRQANGTLNFIGSDDGSNVTATGTTVTSINQWYHVVAVKDGTTTKLYLDGQEEATGSANATTSWLGSLILGKYFGTTNQSFNGKIDQVRIFNRGITPEEVSILYNETNASDINPLSDGSGVALYTLDYDASDAGGLYDGTPTDVEFGVGGQINYGARFNGSSAYISSSNILDTSSAFSYSLWVKPNTIATYDYLIGHQQAGSPYAGVGLLGNASNTFALALAGGSPQIMTPSLTLGAWTHLVLTHDGSGNYTCYTNDNGSPITYSGATSNNSSNPFRLGFSSVSGWGYYDGDIDQVRIFSKALSSSEVSKLYGNGAGEIACVYTSTTDLPNVGGTNHSYYKFDNDVLDYSGNGYDGTSSSMVFAFGKFGQAAIGDDTTRNFVNPQPFNTGDTISFWTKRINAAGGSFGIFGQHNGTYDFATCRVYYNNDNTHKIQLYLRNSTIEYRYTETSYVADNGNWSHWVITLNSPSSNPTVYLNSVQQSVSINNSSGSMSSYAQSNARIGRGYINGTVYNMNGYLDQMRTFTSARTLEQIQELYNEKPETDTSNFKTVLYEGNGGTQYVSNIGFEPDFVWIKDRNTTGSNNVLSDSVRGATKFLISNLPDSEYTSATGTLSSFDSNGFSLSVPSPAYDFNINGNSYVAWCWKGGGDAVTGSGTNVSNITQSVNAEAGFSIVKYTEGSGSTSFNHGLGVEPDITIIKRTNLSGDWLVLTNAIDGSYDYLVLNSTAQANTSSYSSDSTSINVDIADGGTFIAYCFHSVSGISSIGSYSGTGSSGNAITGLGFEPNWLIVKRIDASGNSWLIVDNKRVESNGNLSELFADTASAEGGSGYDIDFTSDGFTLNTTTSNANASGTNNYIYMAFK